MKNVLFVDDNPVVLNGYRALFSKQKEEWNAYYAVDGVGAIDFLRYVDIDIIVADIYMPHVNGLELLEHVKREYPEVVRIIISASTDKYHNMQTVKLAHRFFQKPTDLSEIKDFINQIYYSHCATVSDQTRRVLSSIKTIPSAPVVYNQLMQLLKSDDFTLKQVGELIERDAGMSAAILKVVNSSFMGLSQRVHSPTLAASLLGVNMVKNLVLTAEIFTAFPIDNEEFFNFHQNMEHALLCADFVKAILESEQYTYALSDNFIELGYLMGLLHDVGQIILASTFPKEYRQICEFAQLYSQPLWEVEEEVFGTTHGEVGAYLLTIWGFDPVMVEAIAYHHRPSKKEGQSTFLLAALHFADLFAYESQPRHGEGRIDPSFIEHDKMEGKWYEWHRLCYSRMQKRGLTVSMV